MRIRIVTSNTFPEGQAATSRIRCYAKAFRDAGHQVQVVAPSNSRTLKGATWLNKGSYDGIPFAIILNSRVTKNYFVKYIWAAIAPSAVVINTISTLFRSDVFLIYCSTLFPRLALIVVLRLFRKKVIIELNELPFSTDGSKMSRLPGVKRLLRYLTCRTVLPLSNGALVISEALANVVSKHAPKVKILKIPILAEEVTELGQTETFKATDPLYIFHAGSMSERKDGILSVFRAFAIAHQKIKERHGVDLKFFLTNRIAIKKTALSIQKLLAQHDLEKHVIEIGYCEEKKLRELLGGSLALVINKPQNLQNTYNFPTKLAVYLASGRPVILAAADTEANVLLINQENSIVVAPDDIQGISNAIIACYEDPRISSLIGKSGWKTAIENFDYRRYSLALSDFTGSL